jgi:oligopeptidase B
VSRFDESEESAKVTLSDGFAYYTRKVPSEEYRVHCRVDRLGREDIYLDENVLAADETKGGSFFHLGFLRHTIDCKLVAYGVDTSGSERYTTYFLAMPDGTGSTTTSSEVLGIDDVIPDCYEDFEFSSCKWT